MPQVCRTCTHPKRAEIDRRLALCRGSKAGIAREYGLSDDSVERHEAKHLDPLLVAAAAEGIRNEVLTARQVSLEAVSNARKIANSCLDISPKQYLEALDPLLKANEQWAKINREIGADQLTAFFVSIGATNENAVKQAWEASRMGREIAPEEAIHDALEVLKLLLPQCPTLAHYARTEVERTAESCGMLPAHTNGDGTNGRAAE